VTVEVVDKVEEFFGREVLVNVFETGVSWRSFPTTFPTFTERREVFLPEGRNTGGEGFVAQVCW
jgi:hypothetical protein